MLEIGDSQREYGKLMFARDMQHGTARHKHLEVGAGLEQVDQLWGGFHHLLERWLLSRSWQSHYLDNRRGHQVRIMHRSKSHNRCTIGKVGKQFASDVQRHSRFANSTWSSERDEANVWPAQERTDGCYRLLTPNQGGQWCRYVMYHWLSAFDQFFGRKTDNLVLHHRLQCL
jgi:hypothetical protein